MSDPADKRLTTRRVLGLMTIAWLVLALIIAVATGLVSFWKIGPEGQAFHGETAQTASPPLEMAPQPALDAYLEEKRRLIEQYGWVDEAAGVARIPLELAMSSLAGEAPQPTAPASPEEFSQNLGTPLPLHALFQDEQGNTRPLGDFFRRGPVLLVLGYYHCPRLCSAVMAGILQSVQDLKLPYSVVAVSIDPRETPAMAAQQHAFYQSNDAAGSNALHLLTGDYDDIAILARQAGFAWRYDEASDQYTHPAGFLIASPQGRISQYFPGVRFERRDVRLALIEASEERTGSLAERIILLCSHYDPVKGRYTLAVMKLVRVFSGFVLLTLLAWLWWLSRRRRRRS